LLAVVSPGHAWTRVFLFAAFRRGFCVNELIPLGARSIREQGEAEVGELLANASVRGNDNALALHTQETWPHRVSNSVLRGTAREGDERLWPRWR
jgi:hypothetical protein